jgi:hypothetical protein
MTRAFFLLAAAWDLAWAALLLWRPELILRRMPPSLAPMIAVILFVAAACVVNAIRVRRWLVLLTLIAKLTGPPSFVVAASQGYLSWDQWWLPVVNDIAWMPGFFVIWKRAADR